MLETGVSEARPSLTLYLTDSENLCQYLKGSCLLDDEYRPVDWSERASRGLARPAPRVLLDLNDPFARARSDLLNPLRNPPGKVEQRLGMR